MAAVSPHSSGTTPVGHAYAPVHGFQTFRLPLCGMKALSLTLTLSITCDFVVEVLQMVMSRSGGESSAGANQLGMVVGACPLVPWTGSASGLSGALSGACMVGRPSASAVGETRKSPETSAAGSLQEALLCDGATVAFVVVGCAGAGEPTCSTMAPCVPLPHAAKSASSAAASAITRRAIHRFVILRFPHSLQNTVYRHSPISRCELARQGKRPIPRRA